MAEPRITYRVQPEELERLRPGRDAFRAKPFFGNELVGVVDELLAA